MFRVVIAAAIAFSLACGSLAHAAELKKGDKFTIIVPWTVARLCPTPDCGDGKQLARIPKGTILTIQDITCTSLVPWPVTWFKVTFNGQQGWVSIFNTDKQ